MELPVSKDELDHILKEEVEINEMYEEWAIHDYESDIEGMEISEWANIWELNELAEAWKEPTNTTKNN